MSFLNLSKRDFLLSGVSLVSLALPLSACRNDAIKDIALPQPSSKEHDVLSVVLERLFPISGIDQTAFSDVALSLLQSAKTNDDVAGILKSAIQAVEDASNNAWLNLTPSKQTAVLKKLESEPWFTGLLLNAKAALFNNPKLWSVLNYGGPSLEEGGYKYDGFDDINWLPESP